MPTKVIHFHIWDPRVRSVLFKSKANDRAEVHTVTCSQSEACALFAKGKCIARGMFTNCKHGYAHKEEGPTKRAKGIGKWVADQTKRHEGVGTLKDPPRKITRIPGFIWLPYSHMSSVVHDVTSFATNWTHDFIPEDQLTADLVVKVCDAKPQALFGGEITSYQRDVVPAFISHLTEDFPEILAEAATLSARIREALASMTKVGRKAVVRTLLPDVGTFEKGWRWDGTHLYIDDPATARAASIFPIVEPKEIRIRPTETASIKVTDDGQVGPGTIFVD